MDRVAAGVLKTPGDDARLRNQLEEQGGSRPGDGRTTGQSCCSTPSSVAQRYNRVNRSNPHPPVPHGRNASIHLCMDSAARCETQKSRKVGKADIGAGATVDPWLSSLLRYTFMDRNRL